MADHPPIRNHIPEVEGSDTPVRRSGLPKAPDDRFACSKYDADVRGSVCVGRQRDREDSLQRGLDHCVSGRCQQGKAVAAALGAEVPDREPAPQPRRGPAASGARLELGPLLRPGGQREVPHIPSALEAAPAAAASSQGAKAAARLAEMPYQPTKGFVFGDSLPEELRKLVPDLGPAALGLSPEQLLPEALLVRAATEEAALDGRPGPCLQLGEGLACRLPTGHEPPCQPMEREQAKPRPGLRLVKGGGS